MFIEFANQFVDLNSIESASFSKEDMNNPFTYISMIGKSGTVYKEPYNINNDPKEEEIVYGKWLGIKHALRFLNLSYTDPELVSHDIPF